MLLISKRNDWAQAKELIMSVTRLEFDSSKPHHSYLNRVHIDSKASWNSYDLA